MVAASLQKRVSFHSRAGAFPTHFVLRKAVGPLFMRAGGFLVGGFLFSALPLRGYGRSGRVMGHTPLDPPFPCTRPRETGGDGVGAAGKAGCLHFLKIFKIKILT